MKTNDNSGFILVAVTCFTALAAILAAGLLTEASTQINIASRQISLEQAFYLAEGGAERAVACIRNGSTEFGTITGSIGNGRFSVTIVPVPDHTMFADDSHVVSGSLALNPNNSPLSEFLLVKPDGSVITRDDVKFDNTVYTSTPAVYYSGPVVLVHLKPQGDGNQNTLNVDSAPYSMNNSDTFDFTSPNMTVTLANDSINQGNGQANGNWYLSNINGTEVAITYSGRNSPTPEYFTIYSIGSVNGVSRLVIMEGVHQQSWARYAMYYNSAAGPIWIGSGESFLGPFHANSLVYISGDPYFDRLLSTTAGDWGPGSDVANVTFMDGYQLNAQTQSMAAVNFTTMRDAASLVVTGLTSIDFDGTNLYISNSQRGWTNINYLLTNSNLLNSGTGLIYVASFENQQTNIIGIVSVGGILDGRITIVTDYDIRITNHITYAVHPTNGSDDALGLVARNDVVVMTNAPDDLQIFAHLIAACPTNSYSHGFYVQDYASRPASSNLNVFGGIAQYTRGAVGLMSGQGYLKNYQYDTRFENSPPPNYPTLTNEYTRISWRDRGL